MCVSVCVSVSVRVCANKVLLCGVCWCLPQEAQRSKNDKDTQMRCLRQQAAKTGDDNDKIKPVTEENTHAHTPISEDTQHKIPKRESKLATNFAQSGRLLKQPPQIGQQTHTHACTHIQSHYVHVPRMSEVLARSKTSNFQSCLDGVNCDSNTRTSAHPHAHTHAHTHTHMLAI